MSGMTEPLSYGVHDIKIRNVEQLSVIEIEFRSHVLVIDS